MGELNTDYTEQERAESPPLTTNTPLVIALTCALMLLALFAAVIETEGQAVTPNQHIEFGSLRGRVTESDTGNAVVGVRVLVKRVHAGAANFYFDRITGADGSFVFENLLPGRYTIQIDPGTVADANFPAKPTLVIVDVRPEIAAHADLAIPKRVQTQTAETKPNRQQKQN
jgi:hypothetical protein